MTGFNNFITSPEAVNFSAGLGDAILLNQGDRIRGWLDIGAGIDYTADEYRYGTWTGVGVTTAAGGVAGLRLAGTASRGLEFSHWIPNRWGGARSLWNGNYVTTVKHALSDPFRYRFMPRTWKALNPLPSMLSQQWNRIPYLWKGLVGGGAYGSVSLLDEEEEE